MAAARNRASMERPAPTLARVSLPDEVRWVANETVLFNDRGPFTADIADGDVRLVVVTGENASGKSLLVRFAAAKVTQAGLTPVSISIRERTGDGMRAAFMFGDESHQSTGATSVSAIAAAFDSNLARPNGTVLILDEPELGLSAGYARALGRYIAQSTKSRPRQCSGVIVVTHSRDLVAGILEDYPKRPTHVSLGAPAGLGAWLEAEEVRTVEDLLALREVAHTRLQWTAQQLRG